MPLGGTAVGTGINAHPEYAARACGQLSQLTGLLVREAPNHFHAQASLDAAIRIAQDAGYAIIGLGGDLEGEAREVAAAHVQLALKARSEGKRTAILSGGELTVTVRGNGRGGPNQEYALALADLLKQTPGISALAGDTDGADGGAGSASDPAGAVIDQTTFA